MRDLFAKLERSQVQGAEREALGKMIETILIIQRQGSAEALAKIPDGFENALRDRMLVNSSAMFGDQDSIKARAWAEALLPGAAREAAFQGFTSGWAGSAANAAAEWL